MPKDVASFTVNHSHANSRVIPSAVPTILNLLRHRMIAVAMLACLFAVGMAALLNYFKYRSTTDGIVGGRLIVLGKQIENSIQASLALGIAFDDLGTLTGLMKREQTADGLIAEINVFDADGKCLYSTDQMRMGQPVPASWLAAARRARDDWDVEDGADSAVGMSIKNSFGLTLGYLALRYARDKIDRAAHVVGKTLALSAVLVFAGAALFASLALLVTMRPLARDIDMMEAALREPDQIGVLETTGDSPFAPALIRFFDTVREAEVELAAIRGRVGQRRK